MKITSLLNPKEDDDCPQRSTSSPSRLSDDDMDWEDSGPSQTSTQKTAKTPKTPKTKSAKDEPKWELGDTKGIVAYPVRTTTNMMHIKNFSKFGTFPHSIDKIQDFPQSIPFKGIKEKTGRDCFEVFHYTFADLDQPSKKPHVVMWDYNIGLVRITAFFKSLKHGKTKPNLAIKKNAGLDDLCPSITGGDISAQGYWMPFAAAKALAANFCYDIRHVLIPLFGEDFPSLCLRPNDPAYGSFAIESRIIEECAHQARQWRLMAQGQLNSSMVRAHGSTRVSLSGSDNPTPRKKQVRQRAATKHKRYESEDEDIDIAGQRSDCEEDWTPRPQSSTSAINFTAVNKDVPMRKRGRVVASIPTQSSSASGTMTGVDSHGKKRPHSHFEEDDISSEGPSKSPRLLKYRIGKFTAEEGRAAQALLLLKSGGRERHRTPLDDYIEGSTDSEDELPSMHSTPAKPKNDKKGRGQLGRTKKSKGRE